MAYKIIYHTLDSFPPPACTNHTMEAFIDNKKIWKKHSFTVGYPLLNKCAAHFLAHFCAIIAKLKMSNLIKMVKCSRGRGGGSPLWKWRGCSSENFDNSPNRYQNLVLWACPKFIFTPKRYLFNNNKLYEGTETTLAAVILGFCTLSGTNPQI